MAPTAGLRARTVVERVFIVLVLGGTRAHPPPGGVADAAAGYAHGAADDGGPNVADDGRTVAVATGLLRGVNGTGGGRPVAAFLSVPFAAAPIGRLRFQPPMAPEPWAGVRAVTSFPTACVQKPRPAGNDTSAPQPMAEDCLFLNVFAPQPFVVKQRGDGAPDDEPAVPAGGRPVIVYIHGGGMQSGCSQDFPGAELAGFTDSIVVTVQYRLNTFGFFLHPELLALNASNAGLLDQHAALGWVQANIHAFGGDPAKVQIAGQSSGGSSVAFHLVWPDSFPLYSSAVIQSSAINDWADRAALTESGERLAHKLGCTIAAAASGPAGTLGCLRNVSAEVLFAASSGFSPCYDCFQTPEHPLVLARTGRFNRAVPIMQGNAKFEGGARKAHGLFGMPDAAVSAARYEQAMGQLVAGSDRKAALLRLYTPLIGQIGRWYTFASASAHQNEVCGQQFMSGWFAAQTRMPTFRYVMPHVTKAWREDYLNATHTAELPYGKRAFVTAFPILHCNMFHYFGSCGVPLSSRSHPDVPRAVGDDAHRVVLNGTPPWAILGLFHQSQVPVQECERAALVPWLHLLHTGGAGPLRRRRKGLGRARCHRRPQQRPAAPPTLAALRRRRHGQRHDGARCRAVRLYGVGGRPETILRFLVLQVHRPLSQAQHVVADILLNHPTVHTRTCRHVTT